VSTPLLARLGDPEVLDRACRRATRGKRQSRYVATFLLNRDAHLAALGRDLAAGRFVPTPLVLFRIRDPKCRILVRPDFSDRVVHAALVDEVIAPRFDRSLSPSDYACRPGYGAHRAVLALQRAMQRHRFAVHLDVRAYFPSIDLDLLDGLVARRVKDTGVRDLVAAFIAQGPPIYCNPDLRRFAGLRPDWPPPGRGIPIGSSLSQYLAAHVYLNAFDHWAKRELRVCALVRYVDDIFVFGHRRADLRRWRAAIGEWLATERGLRLKHPEARVLACAGHINALGYRITRAQRRALPRATNRLRERVQRFMDGAQRPDIDRSIASTVGVVTF